MNDEDAKLAVVRELAAEMVVDVNGNSVIFYDQFRKKLDTLSRARCVEGEVGGSLSNNPWLTIITHGRIDTLAPGTSVTVVIEEKPE